MFKRHDVQKGVERTVKMTNYKITKLISDSRGIMKDVEKHVN